MLALDAAFCCVLICNAEPEAHAWCEHCAFIGAFLKTLLSKINKPGAGGEGGTMVRLGRIAAETGYLKLCTQGLAARCFMIGTLTAGQFGIFDSVMGVLGASKFHFHNPDEKH